MNTKTALIFLCCLTTAPMQAQTSRAELLAHMDLTAGNYCNYPNPTGHVTPAPKGARLHALLRTAARGSRQHRK